MPRPIDIALAEGAQEIGETLIHRHHDHLEDARILYLFTNQRRKRCDRVRLGSAAKLSSVQRFLSSGMQSVAGGYDFLVMIDRSEWSNLAIQARQALIDHELCHCALFVKDDSERPAVWLRWTPGMEAPEQYSETRWGMRAHDVEEFSEVLNRHGFWKHEAPEKAVADAARQLFLPNPERQLQAVSA